MADRDALAAFDDDLVDATAADYDVPSDRLVTIARTHQENVRALPGVDDIVYEWRNYFHMDPLVGRTDAAYYLALPDHVWAEFTDDLAIDGDERSALLAVHDRQARRAADDAGLDGTRFDTEPAIVLTRP